MKEIREVARFKVKGKNGEIYTIIEYQEYHIILAGGNTKDIVEGLKLWKTSEGHLAEPIDAETFQIWNFEQDIARKI